MFFCQCQCWADNVTAGRVSTSYLRRLPSPFLPPLRHFSQIGQLYEIKSMAAIRFTFNNSCKAIAALFFLSVGTYQTFPRYLHTLSLSITYFWFPWPAEEEREKEINYNCECFLGKCTKIAAFLECVSIFSISYTNWIVMNKQFLSYYVNLNLSTHFYRMCKQVRNLHLNLSSLQLFEQFHCKKKTCI